MQRDTSGCRERGGLLMASLALLAAGACERATAPEQTSEPGRKLAALVGDEGAPAAFGGTLVERWDARLGIASSAGRVTTWTGQVRGVVLTAAPSGQPSVEPDAPYFGGQPVVKTAKQGPSYASAAVDTALVPRGSRPYVAIIYRTRTRSDSSARVVNLGTSDATAGFALYDEGRATRVMYTPDWPKEPTSINFSGNADQRDEPSVAELWVAADGVHYARDGAEYPMDRATNLPLVHALTDIAIGNLRDGSQPADASIAEVVLVSSTPSAAQRAAYVTYARATWGLRRCGDGRVEAPEQCDDGNGASGDGCSSTCTAEVALEATPDTAFGSPLVEWWDARRGVGSLGGRVTSWVGQKQGIALRSRAWNQGHWPRHAADGSAFASRPVVQCDSAGPAFVAAEPERDLLPVGARGYLAVVHRTRADRPGDTRILDLANGTTARLSIFHREGKTRFLYAPEWPTRPVTHDRANGPTVEQTSQPSLTELWMDVDGVHYAYDGVEAPLDMPDPTPLVHALRSVTICNLLDGGQPSESSIAQLVVVGATPSLEARQAYRAQVAAQWGVRLGSPQSADSPVASIEQALMRYEQSPAKPGSLGASTGAAAAAADGRSWSRPYQNGTIYYAEGAGAHVVYGPLREAYTASGAEAGPLGYPLSDSAPASDGEGFYNNFTRGMIYWSPVTGAVIPMRW